MMQFTYDVNSEPMDKALEAFAALLGDNAPALIADDYRQMIAEQSASEGSAGGTPWAALAPSTVRSCRSGSTILNSTGALLVSLIDSGGAGHIEESDGQSLTLGSNLFYALFQQTGAGRGFGQTSIPTSRGQGRGLPARPIITLSDERSAKWVELFGQSLDEKARVLDAGELGGKAVSA
jgi:hypothetical protein